MPRPPHLHPVEELQLGKTRRDVGEARAGASEAPEEAGEKNPVAKTWGPGRVAGARGAKLRAARVPRPRRRAGQRHGAGAAGSRQAAAPSLGSCRRGTERWPGTWKLLGAWAPRPGATTPWPRRGAWCCRCCSPPCSSRASSTSPSSPRNPSASSPTSSAGATTGTTDRWAKGLPKLLRVAGGPPHPKRPA